VKKNDGRRAKEKNSPLEGSGRSLLPIESINMSDYSGFCLDHRIQI
jgi:hypothetical protein